MKRRVLIFAGMLLTGFAVACGARPPARPQSLVAAQAVAVVAVPVAPPGRHAPLAQAAPAHWGARWRVVEAFHDATDIFEGEVGRLCAATPTGVKCLGSVDLGPLATTAITSMTGVWGFVYLCGVAKDHSFVCNVPPADRPQVGPPRLKSVVSVDVHAAAHVNGTLSVTTNRAAIGYANPKWAKVRAVTDAVQVASSWYDPKTCYLKRTGEVACVERATDGTPKLVSGVHHASRIWKTDQALWVLTRTGVLLATRSLSGALHRVAKDIVDMAPAVSVAATASADSGTLQSTDDQVPCAVRRDGQLLCGTGDTWELIPLHEVGATRRIFGGLDWACAEDPAGVVRCVQEPTR